MKKILLASLLILSLLLGSCQFVTVPSDDDHVCPTPDLTEGENGNWWLGDKDTGISATAQSPGIVSTETKLISSAGTDYCVITITFSDGSTKEVFVEMPVNEANFITTATITEGLNGAKGIVSVMTALDSGDFGTIFLLDELYAKYGLVSGLATVVKNLYTDLTFTTPDQEDVARTRQFIDTGRWRVSCHSLTHTSYGTGKGEDFVLDEQRLYDEIVKSRDLLRELFPDQRILVYNKTGMESSVNGGPAYMREPELALIAENYIGARFYTGRPVEYGKLVWNRLPDTILSEANLPDILNDIEVCATEGKFKAIATHYVIEDDKIASVGGQSSSWTTVSVAEEFCKQLYKYTSTGELWVPQFDDAVLYMRERATASLHASYDKGTIKVMLSDEMDDEIYNHPLTVKLTVPESWQAVKVTYGDAEDYAEVIEADGERFVYANIIPDRGIATVEPVSKSELPEPESPEIKPTPDKNKPAYEISDILSFDNLDGVLGSKIKFYDLGDSKNTLGITKDNEGESYLEFAKPTGNDSPYLIINAQTASNPSAVVLEMDLKLDRTSTSGEFHLALTNKSATNHAYRMYISPQTNRLTLVDYDNVKPTRFENKIAGIGALPGEWFKLKIEYTLVSESEAKITVSVNNNIILESSNHYLKDNNPIDPADITAVFIKPSNAYQGTISVDNLLIKQIND